MKTLKITLIILIILDVIRITMPYVVLKYAEYKINQIPEYQAAIGDIDLHIIRGSYTIKNLKLNEVGKNTPAALFSADSIDFSFQWRAILHGALVWQLTVQHPVLNFVAEAQKEKQRINIEDAWIDSVKALFAVKLNKIVVNDGELHFRSFVGKPPFDLFLEKINFQADNLHNVARLPDKLFASAIFKGNAMGSAPVNIDMRFDSFAEQPTFKLRAIIEQLNFKDFNDFFQHYTRIKVKQGWGGLYMEAAAANGKIKGYVKPVVKNLQIAEDEEDRTPIQSLYKGAAKIVAKVLENPAKKTTATRITIKGNINAPNANLWSVVGNLLSHAFIRALLPKIDNTIKMQDIELNNT